MLAKDSAPLRWPVGWPRASFGGKRSPFDKDRTIAAAREELLRELRLLGAQDIEVTANLRVSRLGGFLSGQPQPADPGVAVYFTLRGKGGAGVHTVLACDRWNKVEHNLHAIALHIAALRAQERHGVGTIEQAFRGYRALPAPTAPLPPRLHSQAEELRRLGSSLYDVIESPAGKLADPAGVEHNVAEKLARRSCWDVLEIPEGASEDVISAAYKAKAALWHPDKGGTGEVMYVLNAMREDALSHAQKRGRP